MHKQYGINNQQKMFTVVQIANFRKTERLFQLI